MELKLWHTIVSAGGEVRKILDIRTTAVSPEVLSSEATIVVSHADSVRGNLRGEISAKLDALRAELASVLSEREVYFVLFPLTIHYDELVLRRLPPLEQTAWPLLQSERFGINDGGDKFYSFADERLAHPDTPTLVFEVLYFCLSDGFIGRYANDPARIAGYKSTLAARIPTPKLPVHRAARPPESILPPLPGRRSGGPRPQNVAGPAAGTTGAAAQGAAAAKGGHGPEHAGFEHAERHARSRGHGHGSRGDHRAGNPRPEALFIGLFYLAAALVVVLMPLMLVWLSNL
jgi:hypothetical protein